MHKFFCLIGYIKYAMGPITVGYQEHETSITEAADAPSYNSESIGIALAVNDQLSIGYSEVDETKNAIGATTATSADIEALTIAYSMGGMSIKAYRMNATNPNYDANAVTTEKSEIALALAF